MIGENIYNYKVFGVFERVSLELEGFSIGDLGKFLWKWILKIGKILICKLEIRVRLRNYRGW